MTQLLRRSELAVPASNDNMFDKAAGCGADLVFLDLEDAVPPAFKEESRGKAISALNDLDWGRTARAVRINGLDTPWCHDDLIEVVTAAGRNLDTVIIPKARRARDVWWVDVLLSQLEAKLNLGNKIRLEVLIEEVEGLANAEEIAVASVASSSTRSPSSMGHPRVGGTRQPEMPAQGRGPVFGAEQAAALQLGDHHAHHVFECAGQMRCGQHESVTGAGLEPVRHLIGDLRAGADEPGPLQQGGAMVGEIPHGDGVAADVGA